MRAFVVVAVCLSLSTIQGALIASRNSGSSWNALLNARGIFPVDLDEISAEGKDGLSSTQLSTLLDQPGVLRRLYNNYLARFNKVESPMSGNKTREGTFRDALIRIATHNIEAQAGKHTWTRGVNQFTDLPAEEFYNTPLNRPESEAISFYQLKNASHMLAALSTAPSTKDYRNDGVVSPVKDQGIGCLPPAGSCYAFAAAAAAESAYAIKNGAILDLSELEIVACAKGTGINNGCNGGDPEDVFRFYMHKGLALESDFPYAGTQEKDISCPSNIDSYTHYAQVGDSKYITDGNDDTLQALLLAKGPIAVSVAVDGDAWAAYTDGVFEGPCPAKNNHAVVVVGYTEDAWIIKNSWDSTWGESGFMRIQRGVNMCGITNNLEPMDLA